MNVPTPRPRRAWLLVLAFVLGVAVTAGGGVLLLRPDLVWVPYMSWRHGAVPSNGVVMTLAPAAEEVSGAGEGPWLQLELHNVSDAPQVLVSQDPLGEELWFEVRDAEGRELAPRRGPSEPSLGRPIVETTLPPGGRLAWVVDLTEWVRLEGPGPYTVSATRSPVLGRERDGHRCRSNAIAVPEVGSN